MTRLITAAWVLVMLSLGGAPAYGQAPSSNLRRIEISAGVVWQAPASFGSRDANETTSSGGSFRLFSTASELTAATGFAAQFTVALVRRIAVEAAGTYTKPDLSTRVSADAETSNAPIVAAVRVQQFTIGGAGLWYPAISPFGSNATIFVRAGAGLDRRVEDDGKRVVDAPVIEAGGGLKYLLGSRSGGWWRAIGVRGDIYALARGGAGSFDARAHISPALGASVYVQF
jgi:hypothetical protein